MKRTDLEKILKNSGYWFHRDSKHCLWINNNNHTIAVPHHREINIYVAKKILKSLAKPAEQRVA